MTSSANIIALPFDPILDPRRGRPIFNGSVFVGVVDLDPTVIGNRVDVFIVQEDGTQVVIPQPIMTNEGGYTVHEGQVVQLRTMSNYSMTVQDRAGATVFTIPNNSKTGGATVEFAVDAAAESLKFQTVDMLKSQTMSRGGSIVLKAGDLVETISYRSVDAGSVPYGGAKYVISNTTDFPSPNEISDFLITGTTLVAVLLGREKEIRLEQYGAYNDGTSSPGISTAFADTQTYKSPIKFGAGRFDTPSQCLYYGYGIEGDGGVDNSFLGSSTFVGTIIKKSASNDPKPLKNFTLFGRGQSGGQFGIGHDGNRNGWFRTIFDRVKFQSLQTCALVQFSLGCQFNNVEARDCGNGFFFVGPRTPGSPGWNQSMGDDAWYNNIITFTNPVFINCSGVGIDFIGANLTVINPWFQSGGRGIRISGGSAPTTSNLITTPYQEQMDISVIELRNSVECTISGGATFLNAIGGDNPGAVDNVIIVDNGSVLYENGAIAFIDSPSNARRLVTNNSKVIALSEYNNSVLNIIDSTSRYYSLSTFVEDYNYPEENEVVNPQANVQYQINNGTRVADGAWEVYVTTPEGRRTSFTMYGEQSGSNWTVLPVGAFAVSSVNGGQFTVTLGGASVLTFTLNTANGSLTVSSAGSTVGTLRVAMRRILERQRQPES